MNKCDVIWAILFKPAFQESAACGSVDRSTHEATAMHNKHMSDCFRLEKGPSLSDNRRVLSTTSVLYVAFIQMWKIQLNAITINVTHTNLIMTQLSA